MLLTPCNRHQRGQSFIYLPERQQHRLNLVPLYNLIGHIHFRFVLQVIFCVSKPIITTNITTHRFSCFLRLLCLLKDLKMILEVFQSCILSFGGVDF